MTPADPGRPVEKKPRDRRYWFRLLRLALFAIIFTAASVPMGIGAIMTWSITHWACTPTPSPAAYGLPYREIDIPLHLGGVYRGYFLPGTNGATVLIVATIGADRGSMLPEASIPARHGYNVMLYESRACAGKGANSLGYLEVDDVGDVLSYLKQNQDGIQVDLNRIALHGFSSAGATAIMAATRYPEVRAVLAEGGYHNAAEQMGFDTAHTLPERLIQVGAQLAYGAATGQDLSVLDPLDAVSKIPPRPLFLIYGSREVTLSGARKQLAAALTADPHARADLWVVPGSGHGGYLATAPADYEQHLIAFYDCAMLAQCDIWNTLRTPS